MLRWTEERKTELRQIWASSRSAREVGERLGLTVGQVSGISRRLGLSYHNGHGLTLTLSHAADREARTVFPVQVKEVGAGALLKPGDNQRKLGGVVTKGAWAGMPIYSLTLEERATCPRSCEHWLSCYGNNMPYAKRYRHGDLLVEQLAEELHMLQRKHVSGFVVRLHILGDFYSVEYAEAWTSFLRQFPALRLFGYTARSPHEAIGAVVFKMRESGQASIRFSGLETLTLDSAVPPHDGVVVCPVQTGRTKNCGTCALCWSADRIIGFIRH